MDNFARFATPEIKTAYGLKKGDVMEGGRFAFTEWSRGMRSYKCVEIATGKPYKTRVSDTLDNNFRVIGHFKIDSVEDKFGNDGENLKDGDLFVIEHKKTAELYKFKSYSRSNIVACSVFDENRVIKIDKSFTVIKIDKFL